MSTYGVSAGSIPLGSGVRLRVISLNVQYGAWATPARVASVFEPFQPDIIGFCEVPAGDWSAEVGRKLGLEHVYVGKLSSAHHKDKYKSILSRTPLESAQERVFQEGCGWNPASIVWAETSIAGMTIGIGSLHICENGVDANERLCRRGHSHALREFIEEKNLDHLVIMGDFNNRMDDPALGLLGEARLRPTWRDLNFDVSGAFTYSAVNAERLGIIDHIMYGCRPGTRAIAGGIIELESPLADHKPIWADIEFPRKG